MVDIYKPMPKMDTMIDTSPPKQKQDGDVSLFLLEVLIDRIKYFARPFAEDDLKTCVRISLPDHSGVEPLVICDDDSLASQPQGTGFYKYFNVGKSVLFALQKNEINKAMSRFNIDTTVFTPLSKNQSSKISNVLGHARINFTKEFVKARQKYLSDPSCVSCEVLQDTFTLLGSDNSNTGEISMYLRISCFGKLIVTRFQGTENQLTLGAGMSGPRRNDIPYECDFGSNDASQESPDTHLTSDDLSEKQREKLHDTCKKLVEPVYPETMFTVQNVSADVKHSSTSTAKPHYNSMPCQKQVKGSQHKMHAKQTSTPMACRNTEGYCLHVPQGRTKKYEEIGTTLTGNELKIKVPAASAIIKRISQTHCAIQRPYDRGNKPQVAPCDPPCGKNQISLAIPLEDTCCSGAPPADTQFSCTTEGCTQIGKHAATAGFSRNDPKDPKPEKEVLPNKDVYVLKVAKTSTEGDRKCKLELEFTAPKAGDKTLPVQKRNATLQSDACECYRRCC